MSLQLNETFILFEFLLCGIKGLILNLNFGHT